MTQPRQHIHSLELAGSLPYPQALHPPMLNPNLVQHPLYYAPNPHPPYTHHMYGYHHHPLMSPVVEYITSIQPEDVLSGRGGATNSHSGNREFRRLVKEHQTEYLQAKKRDKPAVASMIVDLIRNKGGRFLRRLDQTDAVGNVYYVDIGNDRSIEKCCQALREGAPALRKKETPLSLDETRDDKEIRGCEGSKPEGSVKAGMVQPSTPKQEAMEDENKNQAAPGTAVTPLTVTIKAHQSVSALELPRLDHHEGPIMIRPCARFMPHRPPVDPFPLDQLSPEKRDMYLRAFLPPSNSSRLKRSRVVLVAAELAVSNEERTKLTYDWQSIAV
jgi:hypothetical protein